MDLDQLTPALVLTLGGASIVTTGLTQLVLNAWRPAPDARDRFGPIVALVVGLAVIFVFGILQNATDYASLLLTGLLAGLGGMGVHDSIDAVTS